jgi:hypothetical protein
MGIVPEMVFRDSAPELAPNRFGAAVVLPAREPLGTATAPARDRCLPTDCCNQLTNRSRDLTAG